MNEVFKISGVVILFLGLMAAIACELQAPIQLPETTIFNPYKMSRVERDITYGTAGDVVLKMDIYYPLALDGPLPAVVYVHGGSWYSGDKVTGVGQFDIPQLVARGYLVAAVNYRLAPRHKFPAQIEDVKCAIRFLRANAATYGLDPAHIGAWGDSAGGHLVALLGLADASAGFDSSGGYANQSSQIQAVVDMFGPADLTVTFEKDKSPLLEHVFGTTDHKSQIVRQASPVTYVSSDDPPFLIFHGEKDNQVLLDQSQALYERLVSADVPATMVIVKNCGHGFAPVGGPITPTRTEITNRIADFFDQYLK